MNFRKLFCLNVFICFLLGAPLLAQTPDTVTLKTKYARLPKAIITTKVGMQEEGFLAFYFPYAPDKKISLVPLNGNVKKAVPYKVDYIESIQYPNLKYVRIQPDNDPVEYLAREATVGALTLYTFTEMKEAPVILPVAGLVGALFIPYDQSLFFIEQGSEIRKINRSTFKEELLAYVGSNAGLAEKIRNKTYKYKDTETIIMEFNAAQLNP